MNMNVDEAIVSATVEHRIPMKKRYIRIRLNGKVLARIDCSSTTSPISDAIIMANATMAQSRAIVAFSGESS